MDQSKTDLVMKFILEGREVNGECALQVDEKDILMKGFRGADYDWYSNFFEITNFDMSMSLKESDEGTSTLSHHAPAQQPKNGTAHGQFARWRSASWDETKRISYPLEFDKFSFERVIDSASPIFFESCCKSKTFDSAALVKRLSQGGLESKPSVGYLRIDFTKVLITGISWEDGDLVKEKCDFICQGVTVTYRQQRWSGDIVGGPAAIVWPNPDNPNRTLNIRSNVRRS
jgi:type VI protein secretion system component Hcp